MTADDYREQIAQMSKTLFRYCLSRTNSYHDAEDLAQEILLISCKRENSFPNEKAFYSFVWRTADNILKSRYRDRERYSTAELDDTLSDGSWEELENRMRENEQLSLITRELALLNSNYRKVMVAYYIDGLSVKDISLCFSLSQSMVKYLLFQSRKRIREGVNMERNFGKLSYDPVKLSLRFWGEKNVYWSLFDSKVRQNIIMACYYDKLTEEQLSLELGVPTAYLEEDIAKLVEYGVLSKKKGYYQSNIVILTTKELHEISSANESSALKTAELLKNSIDGIINEIKGIGFYGCDMPNNSIKWLLVSQILHLAYVDKYIGRIELDFPEDKFGVKCFRWLMEDSSSDELYGIGMSHHSVGDVHIQFYDVSVNGEKIELKVSQLQENTIISLIHSQPQSRNDKMICADLIDSGVLVRTEEGVKPNFPYLDKEQFARFNAIIEPIAEEIYSCASESETVETRKKILIEHTPQHLIDYAKRITPLTQFEDVQDIIRILCESGWLLPWKSGMLATTVMYAK
jgi:RNA polymerase sigma factor (sigma-70 family)